MIYSSYIFQSNDGTIAYSLMNEDSDDSVNIYIFKNGTGLIHRSLLCTIPAGGARSGIIKVDDDDEIVFGFYAPCDVVGTIA